MPTFDARTDDWRKAVDLPGIDCVAPAADMYGCGIVGSAPEATEGLRSPLNRDRASLQRRIRAALEALKDLESIDTAGHSQKP